MARQLKAGSVYRRPVSTMDIYPNFCTAAGASIPEGTKLDGVNLLPHLRGENTAAPHNMLFWKNGEMGVVREGNWKLVINNHPPKLQLFDLAADIGEKQDLAETKPKVLDRLHQAWLEWGAAMPPRANPQSPGKKK